MNLDAQLLFVRRHRFKALALLFMLALAGALALSALIGGAYVETRLRAQVQAQTALFDTTNTTLQKTFDELSVEDGPAPCSDAFLTWMRRVAFLPDGVHELLYARGNQILCSVTQGRLDKPINLGAPDMRLSDRDLTFWLDRDLDVLGFPGLSGTFLQLGNYMLVAPPPPVAAALPAWVRYELVSRADSGRWWHRSGQFGLYRDAHAAGADIGLSTMDWSFHDFGCERSGALCVQLAAPLGVLIKTGGPAIVAALAGSLLIAMALTALADSHLKRLSSLPNRFRRRLSKETLVCHYQPFVSLESGRVDTVEVLARWRDVDGMVVFPDDFLPVVEKHGLHRHFTELVVNKALDDLGALPSGEKPLRVHFNIFPRDFDADWLLAVLAPFRALHERFTIIVELVESDSLPLEKTRETVEVLRRQGILTYIDDFGAGFTNINYLGCLAVAGVKLDRIFGMAPDGSLMASLLTSAAAMIKKAGFALVVEGVETACRLETLRNSGTVDQVQGYHISRPLPIAALRGFLQEHELGRQAASTASNAGRTALREGA